MKTKVIKMKGADGVEIEYVRIVKRAARGFDGASVLLSRFSLEQQAAFRAEASS
ncbi:hypothetical protein [Pseudomonas fluorescens]|uniref:Uncharacterized protein n=1 Tax=Pseudomonas fluorescens TaxID=294 RepID=A0A109KNA1_PSEFL|nr:hypothetical protein [Pseudomonas fluorescens]KWV72409.1 hypothetical protein PFL603g_04102 [Pseudomonas fluorescens]VVP68219.1 hypothetical protein PS906_01570 [Pseudomonas fluorescens]